MGSEIPRGIAVVDVGATATKVQLFSPALELLAERKIASRHVEGPPYRHIDPEPVMDLVRKALPEFDRILPIDVVVPCAHGAALACLTAEGALALPVMDYTAEPPLEIVERYRKIMPGFAEVCCPLLPMALTHGLQLYWQQQGFAKEFARISTIVPWMQYVGFRLGGKLVTEITSMSCQTQLVDVRHGEPSSLVRRLGWERYFPELAMAWEETGELKADFRGEGFRGRGKILAGIHDSSANYLRYMAAGSERFTLLSTGTWIISFDAETPLATLDERRDTASNTDVFGHTVATSRFFGGKEYELVAGDEVESMATLGEVGLLVADGVLALPSFSAAPGPMPGSAKRGSIVGELRGEPGERASLASLYSALMTSEQLDAVGSRHDVIVDGPFAMNDTYLAVLAQLRPTQKVFASALREGTAAGAASLGLMAEGKMPHLKLELRQIAPSAIAGLAAYQRQWKEEALANCRFEPL